MLDTVTVTEVWVDRSFAWEEFSSLLKPTPDEPNSFDGLVRVATVCNNAHFSHAKATPPPSAASHVAASQWPDQENHQPHTRSEVDYFGNPSEVALLRFCNPLSSADAIRETNPVVHEIPFSSLRKYHLVVARRPEGDRSYSTLMKGAPEIVLDHCSHFLHRVKRGSGERRLEWN